MVLCPEHVKTIHRDGFTKEQVRQFLFENTGIPVRHYSQEETRGRHAAGRELQRDHDARRTVLPEIPLAGSDQHFGGRRHGGKVLRRDRQLVDGPGRQPDGDLSDSGQIKEWGMAVTIVHPGNESVPKAATPPPRLAGWPARRLACWTSASPAAAFFWTGWKRFCARAMARRVMRADANRHLPRTHRPQIIEQLRAMDAVVEGLAD